MGQTLDDSNSDNDDATQYACPPARAGGPARQRARAHTALGTCWANHNRQRPCIRCPKNEWLRRGRSIYTESWGEGGVATLRAGRARLHDVLIVILASSIGLF